MNSLDKFLQNIYYHLLPVCKVWHRGYRQESSQGHSGLGRQMYEIITVLLLAKQQTRCPENFSLQNI